MISCPLLIFDVITQYKKLGERTARHFRMHRYNDCCIPPTTMYLWLISLTASKELSILLLKLLKCMEQSVYRLIHLGLRVRYRD